MAGRAVELTHRQWFVVTLLACIPLPLLSLATMEIPLPEFVERAATGFIFFAATPDEARSPGRVVHMQEAQRTTAQAVKSETHPTSVTESRPAPRTEPSTRARHRQTAPPVVNAVDAPRRMESGETGNPADTGDGTATVSGASMNATDAAVPDSSNKGKKKWGGSEKSPKDHAASGGKDSGTTKASNDSSNGGNGGNGAVMKDDTNANGQKNGPAADAPSGGPKK